MKTLRPIAVLLVTALTIQFGAAFALAQNENDGSGQIEGNLPSSRAGMITLQGLAGTNELTYGALPQIGFEAVLENHYWHEDFYRVNAFLPYNLTPGTDYFFSSLGGGVTATGQGVANLGMGYGYYMEDWDRLLRSSVWLDVDDEHSNTYYAAGIHLENLGKFIDFRIDAGLVLTDSTRTVQSGLTGNTLFQGNNLLYEGLTVTDTAFHHAQFEAGGPLALLGDYGISAYAKAYYLTNIDAERDTLGFGFRGEWAITEDATFNFNYTHDDEFDDSTWFSIAVTTPDGAPRNIARPIAVRERFSKPFIRNGRVPVLNEAVSENVLAINPKTANPYVVAHVNPNSGGGNGQFESPFSSIDQLIAANTAANAFDIIYVRPGATPAATTNLQSSNGNQLVLLDNQFLLGSTVSHSIPVAAGPFGANILLTPTDPGSPRPVLTNDDIIPGAVVYAADGNTIGGFTIDGSGRHDGIRGDGNSILGDLIDDNVIRMITVSQNNFTDTNRGIFLPDLSDSPVPMPGMNPWSSLLNNTFSGNNVAFDIGINTNNNDGTSIDTVDGTTLTMTVIGNTVSNNLQNGGILRSRGPGAVLDLSARDLNGDLIADSVFSGNLFDNNVGNGMNIIVETGGNITADIGALPTFVQNIAMPSFSNIFSENEGHGLSISVNSAEVPVNNINMRGNLFSENMLNGADVQTGGDAILVVNGSQNIYMGNEQHGLGITSFNNSSIGTPNGHITPAFAALDLDPSVVVTGADPFAASLATASTFDGEYFFENVMDGANINAMNESWHNIAFLGTANRSSFLDNQGNGISIINNAVPTVDGVNPQYSQYTIRGVEIGRSGMDGIHAEFLGAESALFPEHAVSRYGHNALIIGGQGAGEDVFIVESGDQGVQAIVNHTDIGIFGGGPTIASVGSGMGGDRFYMDRLNVIDSVDDGFEITVLSTSDVNFNMFRSTMVENGGVGLEMNMNSANGFRGFELDANDIPEPISFPRFGFPLARPTGSVFNIGSETAGTGNLFQSNGLQGVFFQTLSPVAVDGVGNLNTDPDVVLGILSPDETNAGPPPEQNPHGGLQSGEYASVEAPFYYTFGRLNFYNNTVQTNGTLANGADGLALQVGTSTNMIASVAQNIFGGNAGADVNIVSVVSQNPDQSINNISTGPNVDLIAMDPVGILDLALGINFALPNPPVSGDLPIGANPNTGAQFTVNTLGLTTPLAGRTELGVFTEADTNGGINKPVNRHGFLVINAYGTIGDLDSNTWTQSGSTFNTLVNANVNFGDTFNTSGLGGLDGNGLLRRGFSTVNFVTLLDPGHVFP